MTALFDERVSGSYIPAPIEQNEKVQRKALRLSAENKDDLDKAADLLRRWNIGAITYNGVYGIFGDADFAVASRRMLAVKERPMGKSPILTSDPKYLKEHVDFKKIKYSPEQVENLQRNIFALGLILPASFAAPRHLISSEGTILNIWTEYPPLKHIIKQLRESGGRALAGTSANKHGGPTIHDTEELYKVFSDELAFIVEADHSKYPQGRKKSTSVVDLTGKLPRLHRLGSVSIEEIEDGLLRAGIREKLLVEEEKIIHVKS